MKEMLNLDTELARDIPIEIYKDIVRTFYRELTRDM